ncbi:ERAD-associated protein [Actinomortierella ambigua]|nr:ERAD-associated protein [Actinomortierella ambigua]
MARKRKAILYCSGILGLALVASCNPNLEHDPREPNTQQQPLYGTVDQVAFTTNVPPRNDYIDHGERIYGEAKRILASAPYKREQRKFEKVHESSFNILSSELFHPRGIIPTTLRLVTQSFASAFSSSSAKDELSSSSSSSSTADQASSDSAKDDKSKEEAPRHDNPKIANALDMLHEAAMDYNNDDALLTLADIYFNGQYKTQRDLTRAFDYYAALADRSGNATAQQMVGFMYSTGIGGAVERSEQRALLYTSFAASANNTAAQMTMGYKHWLGIGTTKNCELAIYYYRQTADRAFRMFKSGPPGGRTMPPPKTRLTDREGGTYGPGASYHGPSTSQKDIQEFLEFDEKFTADGDSAQARQRRYELGVLYYTGIAGSTSIDRDYRKAGTNLHKFADSFFHSKWQEKLAQIKEQRPHEARDAGIAAALLGKMYWRGEGFEANEKTALKWFERGEALDNPMAMNALGCMYRDGAAGLPRDLTKARNLFFKAASKESAEAQVNYARMLLADPKYHAQARQLFGQAATAHNFEAFYYLGDMYQRGIGGPVDCERATKYFKVVTERGDWGDELLPSAFKDYQNGDIESAAIGYLLAAERGIEVGQSNFAWIIDRELPTSYYLSLLASRSASQTAAKLALAESPLVRLMSPTRLLELALVFWTRSANQGDVDSRIKMGDYYFVGIGTESDHIKARICYHDAAQDSSPLALWNLGWMYENGVGVVKDFFMAKKYYDLALSMSNQQAYLPVTLSLLKLNARYMWNYMTGGDVGGADGGFWSISGADGQGATDDDTEAGADQKDSAAGGTQEVGSDVDSMGEKVINARKKTGISADDDGHDPYGTDGHGMDDEEELLDLVVIVGLFGVVAYLMYVRQFRFGGNQQQQQQQQQQPALGADGQPIAGLPGDPHNPGRYAYAAAGG